MLDLLVAGAGTAGCLAARTAARRGLEVLLVDRKPAADVGRKVCGDAVGSHHFDRLGLRHPSGSELRDKVRGFQIFSPDRKTRFRCPVDGLEGFMLDRREFGQRLLREAVDAGAEFEDRMLALEPVIREGYVRGAVFKDLRTGHERRVEARVTIDATGFVGMLRRKIPPPLLPERAIDPRDVQAGYREIRRVETAIEPYCCLYLNQTVSPGGYSWVFPEGDGVVNVGIGVQMVRGFPDPREQLYKHVLADPIFDGSSVLERGAWYVPTRRPLDCMTANGFMVVGDAACLTNPLTGGGIGPSMLSGRLAAEAAADAIADGDVGRGGLWPYNTRFMEEYGAKQAALDVFRVFLQRLGDEDLNYGMSHQLVKEEDVLKISSDGHLRLGVGDRMLRVLRGIRRPSLLSKLSRVRALMREARELYEAYPSPGELARWRAEARRTRARLEALLA